MKYVVLVSFFCMILLTSSCKEQSSKTKNESTNKPALLLNYRGTPTSESDTSFLVYSDQGAWFGFSLPENNHLGGFSGPFLMTQNNGVWSSESLVHFQFLNKDQKVIENWDKTKQNWVIDLGQLGFAYKNDELSVTNTLFYANANTAVVKVSLSNLSDVEKTVFPIVEGKLFPETLYFKRTNNCINIKSTIEKAVGCLKFSKLENTRELFVTDSTYKIEFNPVKLSPGKKYEFVYTLSFLFPDESWEQEMTTIADIQSNFDQFLASRREEKERIFQNVTKQIAEPWNKPQYRQLVKKLILTLQNNWRSAAGGLEHAGLFPSYRSPWFQGFWAWDSWKHATALSVYNPELAKEQVLAMYDYMTESGFIPDAVFRNNLYEENNYRNTKPPLSGWAIWEIYQEDEDLEFVKALYPKIKRQHQWWYSYRDHDQDGICEYGSTDGSLKAAKWGSGMDNAVRFDNSKILKNSEMAFSLNQESVDLNSYLYAEKIYLAKMAEVLEREADMQKFLAEADRLKQQIQTQFYDEDSGWFYDSSLDGQKLIKVMGPEGWIPLWADIATREQAESVHKNIMDPKLFNTKVPFPTLNASHKKFEPQGGYWRGPVWIDQAYFGIMGLKNYGYVNDANKLIYKLIHNAEGVLAPGKSIRENYNPVSGKGLESRNFSWSAAHYLLMLLNK